MKTINNVSLPINNKKELCSLLISSASQYYNYLVRNDKGIEEVKLRNIVQDINDKNIFELFVNSKLMHIDTIQFKINGVYYNRDPKQEDIKVVEHNTETNILKIKVINNNLDLTKIHYTNIFLISDMKFLVKNVEQFYLTKCDILKMPSLIPNVQIGAFDKYLNSYQKLAIETILTNPFTYIWGSPGTGKTKAVLFECAVRYLKENKKIAIFAPTNNALEQVLEGIISKFQEQNIDIKKILRAGTPTSNFAKKYPEICEEQGIAQNIKTLEDKIKTIKKFLSLKKYILLKNEANIVLVTLLNSIEKVKELDSYVDESTVLAKQLDEYKNKIVEKEKALQNKISTDINIQLEKVNKNIYKLDIEIKKCEEAKKIISTKGIIGKIVNMGIWSTASLCDEKLPLLLEELKQNNQKIEELNQIKDDFLDEQENLKNELKSIKNLYKAFKDNKNLIDNKIDNKILKLNKIEITSKITILEQLDKVNYFDILSQLEIKIKEVRAYINKLEQDLIKFEEISHKFKNKNEESIKKEMENYQLKINKLKEMTFETRAQKANIIASTLDTYIMRVLKNGFGLKFDHIFLDEAGYSSVIKAFTICKDGSPLTLLGDHKQLPPICEMDEKEIINTNSNVFFWHLSSIYLDTIFTIGRDELLKGFSLDYEPIFTNIKKIDLLETHRYGQNITNILDSHIYNNNLKSGIKQNTLIYYVDVQNRQKNDLTNVSEAEAIKDIVHFFKTHGYNDYGIITPFNNQRSTIQKLLPSERDNIMTIHRSQGREFNIVLFSPVMLHRFLTNSEKQKAKYTLNVAISRVKKCLILVCDYSYWMKYKNQFITSLLKEAKPFEINNFENEFIEK